MHKLCMIGTGYVGLVSGVCFADLGNKVICVDQDKNKIDKLKKGISPIYEPGLDEILKKNIRDDRIEFTSNLKEAVKKSDIIFLCVGTPNKKNSLDVNLSFVFKAAKEVIKNINSKKIIVTKSTVPVGTGDQIEKLIKRKKAYVISNPEFLREGEAIRDFRYPDRIVIGSNDKYPGSVMRSLYKPLISKGAKFYLTNRRGAELIKYAANAFLATKISFINEIANLCEKVGVNVEDISLGIGSDNRIGSRFLRAGPAYGGSCFPKDTKGLVSTGKKYKTDLSIVNTVIKSNNLRRKLLLDRIKKMSGKVRGKTIAFLGVTFKPNTDDMRDSNSLLMIPHLSKSGAHIKYYDPTGEKNEFKKVRNTKYSNSIKEVCKNADLIILHTEWDEFKAIDFSSLKTKKNVQVFDLRNLFDFNEMKKKKIKYSSIGRPSIN